jgi:hypothetical protein
VIGQRVFAPLRPGPVQPLVCILDRLDAHTFEGAMVARGGVKIWRWPNLDV